MLKRETLFIDCYLNWKDPLVHIARKIKRNIGAISTIRHFVNLSILKNLYSSLVYPFFSYCLIVWCNTYQSSLKPLVILQKKVLRLIIQYTEHSNPIFSSQHMIKLIDLVYLKAAIFMHDFYRGNLPESSISYFFKVSEKHGYNTRLASWFFVFITKNKS